MILTITLNPAVDISYQLADFQLNRSNRSTMTIKTAGGKGLNVTRVLDSLDIPVKATGFLGGANGSYIQRELDQVAIQHDFEQIEGETRNCIAILHGANQTEILEAGPVIQDWESQRFLKKVVQLLPEVDVITASGSLPKGLPPSFYLDLIGIAKEYQIPFLLDASGGALKQALEAGGPTFVKPNLSEFEELMGRPLHNEEEIIKAISTFPYEVPYVMVTLGAKGALVKHGSRIYRIMIPDVPVVNPVGSGDATVAGFAAGLYLGLKDESLFAYSVVMGLVNAIEPKTGYVNPVHVEHYLKKIKVTTVL